MKYFCNSAAKMMSLFTMAACTALTAFGAPEPPVGLTAHVEGLKVNLNWVNGDAGTALLDCGFEEAEFPAEGWSAKVTNNYNYICSWFNFPSDLIETGNYRDYIRSGEKSAMLYYDIFFMSGDHNSAQDEWLITPSMKDAAYLELYYYLDPKILEWGSFEEFPDHYYVKASYDDGVSWDVLWDGRNGVDPLLGWHSLALPLKGAGDVKVAFQGVSDTGESVHLLWALDDIKAYASRSGSGIVEGYTVKLDGEVIGEHIKSLEFTDRSVKTPGKHLYEVFAESGSELSLAASKEVEIAEIEILPPSDVRCEVVYDDLYETYSIIVKWDAPQGAFAPAYYNVYCDGVCAGMMIEDTMVEYSGYNKGIYDYSVSAVYVDPDAESEPVHKRVAIETRLNACNLKAVPEGEDVRLTWDNPESGEFKVEGYEVWRGDTNIAGNLKECVIVDKNAPSGKYRYSVVAVFEDGEKSYPACLDYDNGEAAPLSLPFAEDFNAGFLPSNWTIQNFWDNTPDNLLWQFNDPNGLGVQGDGFDGCFASIDCVNTGFFSLESALVTPSIDVKGCDLSSLIVSFTYDYATDGYNSSAQVELMPDNNGEWYPAGELIGYEPGFEHGVFGTRTATFTLGDMIDSDVSTIRLRWYYIGMMDLHLAVDNVLVTDKTSGIAGVADGSLKVEAGVSGFDVTASEGISRVEVYSVDGRMIASHDAGGQMQTSVGCEVSGLCIVRVYTATTARTVKIIR